MERPAPAPITMASARSIAPCRRLICSEQLFVDLVVQILENIEYHLYLTFCLPFISSNCLYRDLCRLIIWEVELACGYAAEGNALYRILFRKRKAGAIT